MKNLNEDKINCREITDLVSDDFFDSQLVYRYRFVETKEYVLSYLRREDLIARDLLGSYYQLGNVILDLESTIEVGDAIETEDAYTVELGYSVDPFDKVSLRSLEDLQDSMVKDYLTNTMTDTDYSTLGSAAQSRISYGYNSDGRFESQS